MADENSDSEVQSTSEKIGGTGRGAISVIVALIPLLTIGYYAYSTQNFLLFAPAFILAYIAYSAVRINNQWEEAIVLRLGKYTRTVGPGIFFVIPFFEEAILRDLRIRTLDISRQEVITRDNISVGVNAVVFLKVVDTKKSIINIQDFLFSVKQFAQTSLRNVIGQKHLDEVLEKRKDIAKSIKIIVDEEADKWGVDILRIELQDIELPEDMKRVMARQAEAEREKRGVIIASEGEVEAAKNLLKAADILSSSKGKIGIRLRELATIADVSQDQSNTIVFYPVGFGTEAVVGITALAESTKEARSVKKFQTHETK